MKTIEEILNTKESVYDVVEDRYCCTNQDTIDAMREYATQFIDEAINKTEICCNNFYPTISGAELLRIKKLI